MTKQQANTVLLPGESLEPSRRAFLEYAGFGLSALALSGCSKGPSISLVPGAQASTSWVAGKAYWVASSCGACSAACGVLAKCRDGRPIKLEGNPGHGLSRGGLCATGQADILSLYDSRRVEVPLRAGQPITWAEADGQVRAALETAKGGRVRLLTGTENGPSTRAAIKRFLAANPGAQHVTYDALSASALLDAHKTLFGTRVLPSLHFDRARMILSFGADFLGTWISPVTYARDYAAGRRPDEGVMSSHVQVEAAMSLTGSVADVRAGLTPEHTPQALAGLCSLLERKASQPARIAAGVREDQAEWLEELAVSLWDARGQSLVVCGQNDRDAQLHTAYANHLLGNYGETLSLARPSLQRSGDDEALLRLKAELDAGQVDCLILSSVNPAYNLPGDFAASIAKAKNCFHHTAADDETGLLASLVLPVAHTLESWGDTEAEVGRLGLQQPVIPSLRKGRTLRRLLSVWTGDSRDDDELLREHWESEIMPRMGVDGPFQAFWEQSLQAGYVELPLAQAEEPDFNPAGLPTRTQRTLEEGAQPLELMLLPSVGLLDGEHAHNPWLQEMPNPVSKVTWDNYLSLSAKRAERLKVEQGDLVRVSLDEQSLELPVLIQRGQHEDIVAVSLGYGRRGTDRFSEVGPNWIEGRRTVEPGETVGVNVAGMLRLDTGGLSYARTGVTLARTGRSMDLAATQEHHTLEVPKHLAPRGGEVRDAVRSASLAAFVHDPEHALEHGHQLADTDLWESDHDPKYHHWGMAVDLSSCTGCSACVISCQAENNVPVVGKDEVLRHREMHWMRIDRYYEGEGEAVTASHQPMFCQQCDNAPCEAVCPVLATVHSTEGLNQQVYNRCVGTRYCANTCPYKVRRFNWFDYPREEKLQNHSLNPDVTIRTRGVMEKCSFCAQRIQEARSEAIAKGVPLAEGDIKVACQQSCPTQAIVFGDMSDPASAVSKLKQRMRSYRVLEELNVKPSVNYLARIRNKEQEGEQHG